MPAYQPEECEILYGEALNRGDVEAAVELYEPDAKIRARAGSVICGTDAIREHVQSILAVKPKLAIDGSVLVSSDGNIALTSARWNLEATLPDGQPMIDSGQSMEVVRRQADGTWRFVLDSGV
jgi:uncharacterized protein (TIGR02246 family)